MRILIPLMVVSLVVLACVPAAAESRAERTLPAFVPDPPVPQREMRGHVLLELSPVYLEIHRINEAALATESTLLADLAAATDEAEVDRLVRRLERLDTDRRLAVLKVRIRYARLEGRFDEAFSLRQEMLQLLQRDNAPVM